MHLFSRTCLVVALTSSICFSAMSVENRVIEAATNEQAKYHLIEQLNSIAFFSGNFTQKVFDSDNNQIQQGTGTMVVSKPNKVHWQTNEPEESLIVSDGETLWFYDPFIEQVSAFSLDNAIANTPILLLTNESDNIWDDYNVTAVNNTTFAITSHNAQSQIQSLMVSFMQPKQPFQPSEITAITIHDITGQRSEIVFNNTNYTSEPNAELFQFTIPEGVFLDEQR